MWPPATSPSSARVVVVIRSRTASTLRDDPRDDPGVRCTVRGRSSIGAQGRAIIISMVMTPAWQRKSDVGAFTRLLRAVPVAWLRRLPSAVSVPWLSHRQGGRDHVADVRPVPLPAPFRAETYWLRTANERSGPAASIWLGAEELMRIDGLRGDCHVHYDLAASRPRGGAAISARRVVADADIARWAADELRLNLRYSISMQRPRLRRSSIDREVLETAARRLQDDFEALLARYGDDRGGE